MITVAFNFQIDFQPLIQRGVSSDDGFNHWAFSQTPIRRVLKKTSTPYDVFPLSKLFSKNIFKLLIFNTLFTDRIDVLQFN